MTGNHWDEPGKVEQLLSLWSDGTSGGRIAQIMGLTRNSVMGKLNKLGALSTGRQSIDRFSPNKVQTARPNPARSTWSEESLTEKWADRKKKAK